MATEHGSELVGLLGAYKGLKLWTDTKERSGMKGLLGAYKGLKRLSKEQEELLRSLGLLGAYKGLKPRFPMILNIGKSSCLFIRCL